MMTRDVLLEMDQEEEEDDDGDIGERGVPRRGLAPEEVGDCAWAPRPPRGRLAGTLGHSDGRGRRRRGRGEPTPRSRGRNAAASRLSCRRAGDPVQAGEARGAHRLPRTAAGRAAAAASEQSC